MGDISTIRVNDVDYGVKDGSVETRVTNLENTSNKILSKVGSIESLLSGTGNKNEVNSFGDLPMTGNNIGDTRYVISESRYYRWDGTQWVLLSWTTNNPGYVPPGVGIWGVEIDLTDENPKTCITALDDLVDGSPDFFGERPCVLKNGEVAYYLNPLDFSVKEDGTPADISTGADGDVMIEFPRLAWFIESTANNTLIIKLTNHPDAHAFNPKFRYYAHTRDTEGDRDFLYLGAYLASGTSDSKLTSLSGKTPLVNTPLTTFRTNAHNIGEGYDIMSFYPMTLLQVMYIMKYQNLDAQTVFSKGICSGSYPIGTGGTEALGLYAGSLLNDTTHNKFAGLEDFYGNVWRWVDGIYVAGNAAIFTAFKNFNDTGAGYLDRGVGYPGSSTAASGSLRSIKGTTESGFTPLTINGTSTTYFCDGAWFKNGSCGVFGGSAEAGAGCGPFAVALYGPASGAGADVGSRLMFL